MTSHLHESKGYAMTVSRGLTGIVAKRGVISIILLPCLVGLGEHGHENFARRRAKRKRSVGITTIHDGGVSERSEDKFAKATYQTRVERTGRSLESFIDHDAHEMNLDGVPGAVKKVGW